MNRTVFRSMALAMTMLVTACAAYPPPPGYAGESWRRHVRRCLHNYPRYDPRTDLIERPGGAYRCPL